MSYADFFKRATRNEAQPDGLKCRSVSGGSAEMPGRMWLFYRDFPQLRAQIPSLATAESEESPMLPVGPEIPSSAMTNSSQGGPAPLRLCHHAQLAEFVEPAWRAVPNSPRCRAECSIEGAA